MTFEEFENIVFIWYNMTKFVGGVYEKEGTCFYYTSIFYICHI